MIYYFSNNDFILKEKIKRRKWIKEVILKENLSLGNINFIFCSDDQLLEINIEHLNHNFYTDIITFDYREDNKISGDIYISIDRIIENAKENNEEFNNELNRVLIHGVLHIIGYNDKTKEESKTMREKEDYYIRTYLNF